MYIRCFPLYSVLVFHKTFPQKDMCELWVYIRDIVPVHHMIYIIFLSFFLSYLKNHKLGTDLNAISVIELIVPVLIKMLLYSRSIEMVVRWVSVDETVLMTLLYLLGWAVAVDAVVLLIVGPLLTARGLIVSLQRWFFTWKFIERQLLIIVMTGTEDNVLWTVLTCHYLIQTTTVNPILTISVKATRTSAHQTNTFSWNFNKQHFEPNSVSLSLLC